MVDQAGLQNLRLQDVIVTPGGTPTQYFMRLLQGKSTNSADVQAQIESILAALTGKADKSITLTAGTGLTGGGDLSADRSFAIDTAAEAERIRDVIGTALVSGANITITVDDPGDTITIAASGGGGGGGVNVYTNSNNVSGPTGPTPTSMTAVISATIPASTSSRTFLVSGNIVWRDGVHPMRGSVMLDSTQVWPNTGVANEGIDPVSSTDGMDNLNFSGVIVTIPGDGAPHTISLGWTSASSTGSLTLENRQITCVEVTSGGGGGGAPWWLQPPTAASLSLTTTSGSNLNLTDDADAGLLFIDPTNAADTRRAAYRTLTTPTGDFDFQVFVQSILTSSDFQGIGLWAQESGTGREYWWGAHSNIIFGILRMTGLTFNSTAYSSTPRVVSSGMFLRMVKSGSTFSFYYSGNGKQWQLAFSESTGAWTGNVDRVGIFTRCSFATTSPNGVGGACPLFLLTGTAV